MRTIAAILCACCLVGSSLTGQASPRAGADPIPKIRELLARKPNARIAIVQGSFDWVHNGHVGLIRAVAAATQDRTGQAPRYDLVVVAPTYEYDRKPFLKESFDRRVGLMRDAVAEHPELDGRVVVSDALRGLGSTPSQFLDRLTRAYPGGRFAYALGADSFNDSVKWPGLQQVMAERKIEKVAVPRAGYSVEPGRADTVLAGPKVKISSTEIRAALESGRLDKIADRVPRATLLALRGELERHPLLRGAAPPSQAQRLDALQQKIVSERQALSGLKLEINPRGLDPTKGYTSKLMLLRRDSRGKIREHYLFKRLGKVEALKEEAFTTLANLVGLETPLAHYYRYREPGSKGTAEHGVLLRWKPGLRQAKDHDFTQSRPEELEYLMVSRWYNEAIWNQDVWWGQFLVPKKAKQDQPAVLNIDFGLAGVKRDPAEVQRVLAEHWGIKAKRADTAWTARPFAFNRKLGWDPEHFDSKFTMYGPLLKAYVEGRVELDLERVKSRLQAVKGIPREAVRNTLDGYVKVASEENWGLVPLQAAAKFVKPETYRKEMVARIYRSVDEFCSYLDELRAARRNLSHPIYQTYASETRRDYN